MKSETIIQHKDGRQVAGVELVILRLPGEGSFPYWSKDNISYFRKDGWDLAEEYWGKDLSGTPKRGTVKIEHREYGVEEYVGKHNPGSWRKFDKGRAMYFSEADGWHEVKEKTWEPIETSVACDGKTLVAWVNSAADTYPVHFNLSHGFRWKTVIIEKEQP